MSLMQTASTETPAPTEERPPRFQVFAANRHGTSYILRDNVSETDYPFTSKQTVKKALAQIKSRPVLLLTLLRSPSSRNAYMAVGPDLTVEL